MLDWTAEGGCPHVNLASPTSLFPLLLLRLLRLLWFLWFLGSGFPTLFSLDLLFALLDDFGLGRGGGRLRGNLCRSGHHFFFDRSDVGHRLVPIGKELQLLIVRQVRDTQHLAEHQLADVRLDGTRNV